MRASRGRWAIGVAQHGVEGAGEVVGERAAVIVLGQRHQAGHHQQEQEEEVQGEGGAEHALEEGALRGRITLLRPGMDGGEKTHTNRNKLMSN